ncbi:MAG: hypothetical protein Unbinned8210contig1002_44 [Prokaryotic dsDNA virus sp.]|nr:MAG: hypothetical protein Unbinned8210contig1002_44 [Prokaryotic dsDNA virus sp.]|tara:strand:- start:125 stop:355 length:231 start_codon:yes stop_codon:yes gene_type:complete
METILFVIIAFYLIFLNLRIKDLEEDIITCNMDKFELETKVYKKMMEIRSQIKESIKPIKIEKPRRRSTKRRSKVS